MRYRSENLIEHFRFGGKQWCVFIINNGSLLKAYEEREELGG
jgi:hypothetical protein